MYNWLSKESVLATITVGAGTLIGYLIISGAIKRKTIQKYYNGEVLDLLIFNELSECCTRNNNVKPCENEFCVQRNIQNVIKYIDEAKYTIDFAMYTFTTIDIMNALIEADKRGCKIRIITDNEMLCSTGGKLSYLQTEIRCLIDIRVPQFNSVMMHHKFMVIDGHRGVYDTVGRYSPLFKVKPYRPLVLTGSVNWTMQGFGGNWENCLVTTDIITATKLEAEFYRMWDVSISI